MISTSLKSVFGRVRVAGILCAMLAIPVAAGTVRIYVTNRGGTTIDVIDPATNKVVETIGGIESPEVVRFSPNGDRLYIATRAQDVLDVMDRKTEKIIKQVPLSGWANDAMVTNDGKLILICIRNTGTEAVDAGALDIIDAKSLEKIKTHSREARPARHLRDRRWKIRGGRLSRRAFFHRVRPAENGDRLGISV